MDLGGFPSTFFPFPSSAHQFLTFGLWLVRTYSIAGSSMAQLLGRHRRDNPKHRMQGKPPWPVFEEWECLCWEYGRSEARKWLWKRAGTEVMVADERKEQTTEPTKHTCMSHSSHLHLARAARQDLQGHIGSLLSWAEGGRKERQRARWEDLVVPEDDEAACFFLVVVLVLGGPRLAALLFMVSLSQRWQKREAVGNGDRCRDEECG